MPTTPEPTESVAITTVSTFFVSQLYLLFGGENQHLTVSKFLSFLLQMAPSSAKVVATPEPTVRFQTT